jgi:hypothetical protein
MAGILYFDRIRLLELKRYSLALKAIYFILTLSRHFLPYQLPRVRRLIPIFNGFLKLGQSGAKRGIILRINRHNKVARLDRAAALFVKLYAGHRTHRIFGAVAPNSKLYARMSDLQGVYADNETAPRGADFGAVFGTAIPDHGKEFAHAAVHISGGARPCG